jgi:hypothetical protein
MICTAVVYPSIFTRCSNKLVMVIAGVTWSVTHYLLLHVPCCAKYMTEVSRGRGESRTPKLDIDNNDTIDGCTRPSHGSTIVSNLTTHSSFHLQLRLDLSRRFNFFSGCHDVIPSNKWLAVPRQPATRVININFLKLSLTVWSPPK